MYNNKRSTAKAQRRVTELCFVTTKGNIMCFSKLLVKVLKRRFHKLSLAEQEQVRSLVTETKSDTIEKPKKHRKRRTKIMAEETEVKKEEEKIEETSQKPNDAVEGAKTEEKVTEETEQKEEVGAEQVEVQETEPTGNGVRVEDLVTKDELAERLAAFEAKFDAVIKENTDLKEQNSKLQESLSNANTQVADMKDKYETEDFGNSQRKGVQTQNKSANDTFAEYAKRFMP